MTSGRVSGSGRRSSGIGWGFSGGAGLGPNSAAGSWSSKSLLSGCGARP